jgi:hypothetical protein
MDELHIPDADAQRLGRFFADVMATLAEDGVEGAESAAAARALWGATQGEQSPRRLDLGSETLVHGLAAVAVALARELVAVRRAAGAAGSSLADVWRDVGRALEPTARPEAESGVGAIDLT